MVRQRNNVWIGYALIVAGLVPMGFVTHAVWNWYRARSWTPTPAIIVSAGVESNTDSASGSTSTRLQAEYGYQWNGADMHSSSLSPFNSIEIFSGYKRRQASTLKTASHDGESPVASSKAKPKGLRPGRSTYMLLPLASPQRPQTWPGA